MPVRVALVAAFIAVVVAGVGGLATDLGPWYRGLTQPPWKPPDLVFGPVWTLLYTLTAWAGARAWWRAGWAGPDGPDEARPLRRRILAAFLLNAVSFFAVVGVLLVVRGPVIIVVGRVARRLVVGEAARRVV